MARDVTIGFTVTKAEHEKLRKAADKDDRSLADWVRRLALGAVKRGGK